jgi:hypothetical protein
MRMSRAACGTFAAAALAVLLWGLTGCASTPQATAARDSEAKQFASSPAAATVYVYRTDTAQEDSVLWVDGRLVGATLPHTYFRIALDPGPHVISGMAADNGHMAFETRPGQVYFVAHTVLGGQSLFKLMSAENGQKVITNCCALMENWAPGQRPLLR